MALLKQSEVQNRVEAQIKHKFETRQNYLYLNTMKNLKELISKVIDKSTYEIDKYKVSFNLQIDDSNYLNKETKKTFFETINKISKELKEAGYAFQFNEVDDGKKVELVVDVLNSKTVQDIVNPKVPIKVIEQQKEEPKKIEV